MSFVTGRGYDDTSWACKTVKYCYIEAVISIQIRRIPLAERCDARLPLTLRIVEKIFEA